MLTAPMRCAGPSPSSSGGPSNGTESRYRVSWLEPLPPLLKSRRERSEQGAGVGTCQGHKQQQLDTLGRRKQVYVISGARVV
jgi:hypothetical protein